jgi:hypothetical protein
MKLPRLVEADPRGPQVLRVLATYAANLRSGGEIEVTGMWHAQSSISAGGRGGLIGFGRLHPARQFDSAKETGSPGLYRFSVIRRPLRLRFRHRGRWWTRVSRSP